MKTVLGIFILLTVLYCVAGYGEFVTKEEFEELKQIVGSLQKLYTNEKTQNDQLRRKCNYLEGTLKYALAELMSMESRLSKLEHDMESTGLNTQTKGMEGKGQNSSIEDFESERTGVENKDTFTVKETNKNDQRNVTNDHRKRPTMMQKENYSVDRLFRRLNLNPVSNGSERVVFNAWDVVDNKDLGYHQPIVYKNVLINEGNCYHQTTGVFSPSIPGVYVFYFNIIVAPNVELRTELVKDGTAISYSYANGVSSHYNQISNMAIVHLSVGDNVWVRVSQPHPAPGYDIGGAQNSFSGFLLYSDNN